MAAAQAKKKKKNSARHQIRHKYNSLILITAKLGEVWAKGFWVMIILKSETVSLGEVNATKCVLDLCPSWLIKAVGGGMANWVRGVVHASLQQGRIPACVKEVVMRPLLKKPYLDPNLQDNYQPVSNIPGQDTGACCGFSTPGILGGNRLCRPISI